MYKDIYVISGYSQDLQPPQTSKRKRIFTAAVALLLLIFQPFNLFTSLLIIFVLMSGMRLITMKNVKRDLDINMVAILVLSIAIGEAMIRTGTGELLANQLIHWLQPHGKIILMAGIMVFTTLLTSFITNVGAVAITFPVVLAVTESLGIDGTPYFLALAYAASAAFLTPIGYQTNLIVYGPGGYRFRDFFKMGFPVTIVYLAVSLAIIVALYRDVFF
jgi:di/tricarboxylate transporter